MSNSFSLRAFRRGSMIVYGLVIMTSVSILLSGIVTFVVAQMKSSTQTAAKNEAFQIAEAGVYFYRWYLAHEVDGKTAQQIKDFWAGGTAYGVGTPYEAEYRDPSAGAIGRYSISIAPPDPASTIVTVTVTGWTYKEPGLQRKIRVRFRRPSWSEYAVVANDNMRFGDGTEVFGKIHSNNGIRFDGLAHNIVSSSVSSYDDPDHCENFWCTVNTKEFGVHTHVVPPPGSGVNDTFRSAEAPPNSVPSRTDVFEAGRTFPVPTVDFTGILADLNLMKTEAQAGNGRYFDNTGEGRRIILKTDGTFDVCTVNSYDANTAGENSSANGTNGITNYSGRRSNGSSCTNTSCTASGTCITKNNYPLVDNGVIFVEDNVWLEGQINGVRTTIVAANLIDAATKNMFVGMNNLLYTNYDGRDILGVIGQKNVEVIRDSQNVLRLDGALLAQKGRVGRAAYGNYKSTITTYGALGTYQRYGFARTNGTGYDIRNLYFDNNLLYTPPPYFPTGTQYLMDLWEEL